MRGRLTLWQPRIGYRFSIDPLLLVDFVRPPFGHLIDLGSGVGVIGLGLLTRDPAARATLVELQPRLAGLARRNLRENQLGARVDVVVGDLTAELPLARGGCELVVSNPPYRTLAEGPASPDEEVAIAQHEKRVTLHQLATVMGRLLRPRGRAALVFPAARLLPLLSALEGAGLRPLRLRLVHPRAGEPANRVLVEAHKGARGSLVVEAPLLLRDGADYSVEAARLLGDERG